MTVATQLELLPRRRWTAEELEQRVRASADVTVRFTRNRVRMISIRMPVRGRGALRLDTAFLDAPEETIAALCAFLRHGRREDWRRVRIFVRGLQPAPVRVSRPVRLQTRGTCHDLGEIAAAVNARYFRGQLTCRIGWGRRTSPGVRGRTRSIRYGAYYRESGTVLINPRLDDSRVPRAFVEYIVFHEMLHAVVPPKATASGQWRCHDPVFRTMEQQFPELERMRHLSRSLVRVLASGK